MHTKFHQKEEPKINYFPILDKYACVESSWLLFGSFIRQDFFLYQNCIDELLVVILAQPREAVIWLAYMYKWDS